jgi:hypothetical protein
MNNYKLNRALARVRHMNPDLYIAINKLWKEELGE